MSEIDELLLAKAESDEYKQKLTSLYTEAAQGTYSRIQLCKFVNLDSVREAFYCEEDVSGVSRLYWKALDKEVHLRVQGIVADHSLPSSLSMNKNDNFKHFNPSASCQEIVIIGENNTPFRDSLASLRAVHTFFSCSFTEGFICPLENVYIGSIQGMKFKTRYFSYNKSPVREMPIPPIMDPLNILRRHLNRFPTFKFTSENLVEYEARTSPENGCCTANTKAISPSNIRKGLIVELDVVFLLIKTRNGPKRLIPSFRRVTVLDDSCVFELQQALATSAPGEKRKRRLSDVNDESFERSKKMSH